MKRRKNIITGFVITILLFVAGFSVHAQSESKENKSSLPFYSKHIIFSEKGVIENGTETEAVYEVWFNDKGEYQMNTIAGHFAGDYEVWDGVHHYQYTKIINDLTIRPLVNDGSMGFAIPHMLFSPDIIKSVKQDVQKNKLQNVEKQTFTMNNSDRTTTYVLNENQDMMMKSSYSVKGKEVHSLTIKMIEDITSFDPSMLKVDTANVTITKMK